MDEAFLHQLRNTLGVLSAEGTLASIAEEPSADGPYARLTIRREGQRPVILLVPSELAEGASWLKPEAKIRVTVGGGAIPMLATDRRHEGDCFDAGSAPTVRHDPHAVFGTAQGDSLWPHQAEVARDLRDMLGSTSFVPLLRQTAQSAQRALHAAEARRRMVARITVEPHHAEGWDRIQVEVIAPEGDDATACELYPYGEAVLRLRRDPLVPGSLYGIAVNAIDRATGRHGVVVGTQDNRKPGAVAGVLEAVRALEFGRVEIVAQEPDLSPLDDLRSTETWTTALVSR